MPPYEQQVKKYARHPQPGNPIQTEIWALLEAARRMAVAITDEEEDEKKRRDKRKEAIRLNWRLWTIFQADLTLEREDIPREVQINMLTLCKFVDKHSVGALIDPKPEALTVLIDINKNIAAGLAQIPDDPQKAVEAQVAPPVLEASGDQPRERIDIDT